MRRRGVWAVSLAAAAVLTVTAAACTPPTTPPSATTTTTVSDPLPQTPVGDDQIRLNQLQLIGSHNSYHIAPDPRILSFLTAAAGAFPAIADGLGDPRELDYTHASLPSQLAAGIRTFELDLWADPTGNRFSNPKLNANLGFRDPQVDYATLKQPGIKVFHIVDLDQRSTCASLQLCLSQLRAWSDAHPGHLPIVINLELKADALPAPLVGTPVLPWDETQFQALDAELRAGLGDERLITPDDVRGGATDLRTAVTTTGWPTVAESRGKFLFFLDNEGLRDAYLTGHPSLAGRVLFTSSGEGQPDGAVVKENDPTQTAHLHQLVDEGYLVRTRSDAGQIEARTNNTTPRDLALASGAQLVHSDFPPNEPYAPNGYVVTFGTRVAARCNPRSTTPATCAPLAVVEPN